MRQALYTHYLTDNPEGQIMLSPLYSWEKLMEQQTSSK